MYGKKDIVNSSMLFWQHLWTFSNHLHQRALSYRYCNLKRMIMAYINSWYVISFAVCCDWSSIWMYFDSRMSATHQKTICQNLIQSKKDGIYSCSWSPTKGTLKNIRIYLSHQHKLKDPKASNISVEATEQYFLLVLLVCLLEFWNRVVLSWKLDAALTADILASPVVMVSSYPQYQL